MEHKRIITNKSVYKAILQDICSSHFSLAFFLLSLLLSISRVVIVIASPDLIHTSSHSNNIHASELISPNQNSESDSGSKLVVTFNLGKRLIFALLPNKLLKIYSPDNHQPIVPRLPGEATLKPIVDIYLSSDSSTVLLSTSSDAFYVAEIGLIHDGEHLLGEFKLIHVGFSPSIVVPHPSNPKVVFAIGSDNHVSNLYVSSDFGLKWEMIEKDVSSAYWHTINNDEILYILKSDTHQLISRSYKSSSLNNTKSHNILLTDVTSFTIYQDHLVALQKVKEKSQLYVLSPSYKDLIQANLPIQDQDFNSFSVVGIHHKSLFLAVDSNSQKGKLLVSDEDLKYYSIIHSNVLMYKPSSTNHSSHPSPILSTTLLPSIVSIDSIDGLHIANVFKHIPNNPNSSVVETVMTFSNGSQWSRLPIYERPPSPKFTNTYLNIHSGERGLHLYQHHLFPAYLFALGTPEDKPQDNISSCHTYASFDAGITWFLLKEEPLSIAFLNDGNNIVMSVIGGSDVYLRSLSMFDNILDWDKPKKDNDLKIVQLLSVQFLDEMSTNWVVFGLSNGQYVANLDSARVETRECTDISLDTDFNAWMLPKCILGGKTIVLRKKPDVPCFIKGKNIKHFSHPCACEDQDYICDYCFIPNSDHPNICEPICNFKDSHPIDHLGICITTSGYRLAPGSICTGGISKGPIRIPCDVPHPSSKFILITISLCLLLFLLGIGSCYLVYFLVNRYTSVRNFLAPCLPIQCFPISERERMQWGQYHRLNYINDQAGGADIFNDDYFQNPDVLDLEEA